MHACGGIKGKGKGKELEAKQADGRNRMEVQTDYIHNRDPFQSWYMGEGALYVSQGK